MHGCMHVLPQGRTVYATRARVAAAVGAGDDARAGGGGVKACGNLAARRTLCGSAGEVYAVASGCSEVPFRA
jgi:hypothetical protein